MTKRVIFLMSDTGGGHRAAGRAIEAALQIRYPDQFETFYVDVFREYTPPPMKYAPEIYPKWVKHSLTTYGWYFWIFDQLMKLPLARTTLPLLISENRVRRLVTDYQPDIIIVLHGAFSRVVIAARPKLKLAIPIITAILLLGGGEGMGIMDEIALAINARALDAQLAIICGRNEALRQEMQAVSWNQQTYIYGFVNNIEIMMRAADVLITKAGPGTIAEAAISGLPMILSGAIPFQESPNVDYVVNHHAGVYEPTPAGIAGNGTLRQLAQNVRKIAYPNATFDIADEIAAFCGLGESDRQRQEAPAPGVGLGGRSR
mgnify:CR=1 FL=1